MKRSLLIAAVVSVVAVAAVHAQTFLGAGVWERPDQIKSVTNTFSTTSTVISNSDSTVALVPVVALVKGTVWNVGTSGSPTNICPTNAVTARFTPKGGSAFNIGAWTSQVVSNEALQALTLYPPLLGGDTLTYVNSWAGCTNGTSVITWYFQVPINH